MKGTFRVLLLVAAVAGLIALAINLQKRRQAADVAVQDIEGRLGELDPVTRAAAVAKLTADAAEHARASRDSDN
jgi:hypothetical protein